MAKAKGWFKTSDRDGDRTVEQQLVGLDGLMSRVAGKTVLDVGCAEGMLDAKLIDAGAKAVHGLEIVPGHVDYARRHAKPGMTFEVADASSLKLSEQYDVVLLLAILHKLKDPAGVAMKYAKAAREMVVLRLPPAGAVVNDPRSGGKAIDIGAVLVKAGFVLESQTRGTFDEWIGIYSRPKTITATAPVAAPSPAPAPAPAPPPPVAPPAPAPASTFRPWPFGGTKPAAAETKPPEAAKPAPATEQAFEKTMPLKGPASATEAPVPPKSVHPAGDPAVQLPVEKIEMPQMEGKRQDAPRPDTQTRDPV